MEIQFKINPTFTISPIFIFPEAKIMALGGVETGNINAQEAANAVPTINNKGE